MRRLCLVRHGPTHQSAFVGHRDVPADLTDTRQIGALADALPRAALVVSSDLSRAVETASAIAGNRERLPHRKALREFDFGAWDGMTWREVAEQWPVLSRTFWEDPGDVSAPDGESWNAVAGRVWAAVDDLLVTHPGRDLVVVAHFGAILTLVQRALGTTPYAALSHEIAPLSLTEIEISTAGRWCARAINQIF